MLTGTPTMKGPYMSVEPDHLLRYVDEEVFRFNNRKGKDAQRFEKVVGAVTGRRLTYQQLLGDGGRRGK